jgi:branched-subunit amino acid aminotransferase/4-amino-4-deoxychorismate lyase
LGKGAFTTVGIARGRPLFFRPHLERLYIEAGLKLTAAGYRKWLALTRSGIERNRLERGVVRLVLSDGGERGRHLLFERRRATPKVINLLLVEDPHLGGASGKIRGLLRRQSFIHEARALGCFDALLCQGGALVETCRCNLLLGASKGWITPPPPAYAGIARRAILDGSGGAVREARIGLRQLASARQVLLTNSVRGILKVARIVDEGGRSLWQGGEEPPRLLQRIFWQAASRGDDAS